jgi:beta-N-acetylhexosaminidase
MTETRALILGCSGPVLTEDEKAFYREVQPWGFILFGRNIESLEQIRRLTDDLRATVPGRHAPVLIDQEGGRVQRIRPPLADKYPSGADLGAIYVSDREKGLRAAWLMSRLHAFDLLKLGIDVDCLPVLDVPVAGAHDVIGSRAYGHDPETVTAMGRAAAKGLKDGGMLPVMKHMPGHGRAGADSHHNLPVVDAPRDVLEVHDFAPFRAMKDELMAMSAHVVYTAIDAERPGTTSSIVINDIIRGHIGFDGLLMSDDTSMNALAGTIGERARDIVAGGCDIVLHCNGVMAEMQMVVAEAPLLQGKSKARADAVLAGFARPDASDEAALRAEFFALFPSA